MQAEAAGGWEPVATDAGPVIAAMDATAAEKIVLAAADDDHQSGKMWTLFTFFVFVFTFFTCYAVEFSCTDKSVVFSPPKNQ